MWRLIAALILAASATACATMGGTQGLVLHPGEAVVVHLDAKTGAITQVERGAAPPLSSFEQNAARAAMGGAYGPSSGAAPAAVPIPELERRQIPPGVLRISLIAAPPPIGSVLVVENGEDQVITYHAVLHPSGRPAAPTDVCPARAGAPTFEQWPYPLDSIELSAFTFHENGAQLACE